MRQPDRRRSLQTLAKDDRFVPDDATILFAPLGRSIGNAVPVRLGEAVAESFKLTVLYVTHDQSEALAVSDEIIVVDAGRSAQQGSPIQLYRQRASRFMADFIGDANLVDGEAVADGQQPAARRFAALGGSVPVAADAPIGPATLALRPHRLRLVAPGEALLSARCKRADYLGSHLEVLAESAWGELLLFADADGEAPKVERSWGWGLGRGMRLCWGGRVGSTQCPQNHRLQSMWQTGAICEAVTEMRAVVLTLCVPARPTCGHECSDGYYLPTADAKVLPHEYSTLDRQLDFAGC